MTDTKMTEAERWPTTGSEESFRKLSSREMLEAGFTPDSATWAEFDAFRDKCIEEDDALHEESESKKQEPIYIDD